ncbi:MAG: HEAT repeat domain-containing protein [Planctomycetes bacterium]|nr:HEAT repeat domain-containing protein [Planctomycetota bacterium]
MEKALNIALFLMACVAGTFLFVFGIHQIKQKAHSRYATKFLLYLSIVLLGLGAIVGVSKLGRAPVYAQDKETENPLLKHADWIFIQSTYNRIKTAGTETIKELEKNVIEAQKKADELHAKTLISRELSDYLKTLLSEKLEITKQRLQDKKPDMKKMLPSTVKNLQFQGKILKEFARDISRNDSWLAQMMKDAVKENFLQMKGMSFDERIKAGNLKRVEYKETVTALMDNLFVYYRRSIPGSILNKPTEDEPEFTTKYGVIPFDDEEIAPAPKQSAIKNIKGSLLFKDAGKDWDKARENIGLFTTTVLENQTNETVEIIFTNGMTAEISKQEILVGWELDVGFKATPELKDKITGLIKQLGDDNWDVRDKATEKLKKIGPVAKELLEEALKTATEPEVKMRINALLKDIAEKLKSIGTEPIQDNLATKVPQFEPLLPPPPVYGSRPK